MSDEDNGAMVVEPDISDMFFPENDDDNDGTNQSSNQSDSSADNQANLSLMDGMYTELGDNQGYKCTICHKRTTILFQIRPHWVVELYVFYTIFVFLLSFSVLKSSSHLLGHLRTHTGESEPMSNVSLD
jgi:hypothetical protein